MAFEPYVLSPEERVTLAAHNALASRWSSLSEPKFVDPFIQFFTSRLQEDDTVLDLGCGIARDAELLLARGFSYVGIDLSPAMVAVGSKQLGYWRRRRRARLLVMNMAELAFRERSFSAFWSLMSCMHIPRENLPRVLGGAWRVLKPGGLGFLTLPNGAASGLHRSGKTGMKTLVVAWLPTELTAVLRETKFAVIGIAEVGQVLIATVMKPA